MPLFGHLATPSWHMPLTYAKIGSSARASASAPLALGPSTTGPARSLLASRRLRRTPAEFRQQPFDLVGGPGRAEQEALHLVAAFGAQPVELVHGFDALGRR